MSVAEHTSIDLLLDADDFASPAQGRSSVRASKESPSFYWVGKRVFDITVCILLLPLLALLALVLLVINPIWNPGTLFFTQRRMGRHCVPFTIFKFRTMTAAPEVARGPEDPVEADRITPLGQFMRKTRIDEIPQILNVLRGEMSIIGPRPDMYEHAVRFLETVPLYHCRHQVRPGITGFAQVTTGYAEGSAVTAEKARKDRIYIRTACTRMDAIILVRTVRIICASAGR